MSIAKRIRDTRKRLKMNQAQFAEALGVSQGSVSKWEAGRETPRLEAVEKITALTGKHILEFEAVSPRQAPIVAVNNIKDINIVGTLLEGQLWEEEDFIPIRVPVWVDWAKFDLEAWIFVDGDLGVFVKIPEDEVIHVWDEGTNVLVETYEPLRGDKVFVVMEAAMSYISDAKWALWPMGRDRQKFEPLLSDDQYRLPPDVGRVRGMLVHKIIRFRPFSRF